MPVHIITTMYDSNDNNTNTPNTKTRPHSYSSHSHSHPDPHPHPQTPHHLNPQPQRPLSTTSLSTTPVVVLAGKKHPSTPPPPPLPLRSSRRPNSAIAHGIRLFDNSPSSSTPLASSTPIPLTTSLTHGATDNPQPSGNTQTSFHQQHHNQRQQGHGGRISQKKSQILDDIDREASNVCEFMEGTFQQSNLCSETNRAAKKIYFLPF
ncbi:MAG: hypothetical protein JOS17DRAFT_478499 [Linnemannia elongata]|nr:MAG: hypothetical protein JOS17DRAFT_478499 [Linnemannia elongata]